MPFIIRYRDEVDGRKKWLHNGKTGGKPIVFEKNRAVKKYLRNHPWLKTDMEIIETDAKGKPI